MTAKIIPFPLERVRRGEANLREGHVAHAPLDVEIGPVGADSAFTRCATVHADDTLADLHELIIGLFGWDNTHNYFFSHGTYRYEDPILFGSQDRIAARCRKVYSATEVCLGTVLERTDAPLFYAYNLTAGWELRITVREDAAIKQFG